MKVIENNFKGHPTLALCLCDEGDATALWECESICFPTDAWSEGMFRASFQNPSCKIYSLFDMQLSKIAAFAVLYICEDEADLANIAILPSLRRQGIGGALLDCALDFSRSDGVLRTFLEVRESNEAARALYKSRGFTEIGKRKRYYRSPIEDAILMMGEL